MRYITAKEAADLDAKLMSVEGGWSLDQLMELAGLSVAHALQRLTDYETCRTLIIVGPGNNGGDGLVAARHLALANYKVTVLYPKVKSHGIYPRLVKQLQSLDVRVESDPAFTIQQSDYDYIIDAIFGFSFSGEVRQPFDRIIQDLSHSSIPILSVDIPSSWDVSEGSPSKGHVGCNFMPTALISLSAPKPCSRYFRGRHFLGGRFLSSSFMNEHGLPAYRGSEQIVELPNL